LVAFSGRIFCEKPVPTLGSEPEGKLFSENAPGGLISTPMRGEQAGPAEQ
jgi:hypothetical protein